MSIPLSMEALRADREFVTRQIEECPQDAWTVCLMWQDRLEDIDEQIAALGEMPTRLASVAVIFDGLPVIGSRTIRLSFATDALEAYQGIISTAYAERLSGTLNDRGPSRGYDKSRLFVSNVTRGSFGFILEELIGDQREMLPTLLKDVVADSSEMLEALKDQDEEGINAFVQENHPRLVGAIRQFAKVLSDSRASARIVDDQHTVVLSVEDAQSLTTRLREIEVKEETEIIEGVFGGALPESRQFELTPLDPARSTITGPASSDLIQKYMNDDEFVEQTLRKRVRAEISITKTYRNGHLVSERFVLENVQATQGNGDEPSPLRLPDS